MEYHEDIFLVGEKKKKKTGLKEYGKGNGKHKRKSQNIKNYWIWLPSFLFCFKEKQKLTFWSI